MRTEITPRQDSGCTGYNLGIADNLPQPAVLAADRGYDSDKFREDIESRNAPRMIAMRKNRRGRKVIDMTIYSLSNMVERRCNKLKNSRRLATHYDKTADNFLDFIDIACIRLWIHQLSTSPSLTPCSQILQQVKPCSVDWSSEGSLDTF